MSSILKILVDIPCEVYCDYELKGEATPQSIFRIELRKGTYILEFKQNGELLYSQEYNMLSSDEEDLMKVTLSDILAKKTREELTKQIESLNVSIVFHHDYNDNGWIKNFEDNTEKEICHKVYIYVFDACGLIRVYKGAAKEDGSLENGSLMGCINKLGELQIPFMFDFIYPFDNTKVTTARQKGVNVFINKWGEIAFENTYEYVDSYYRSTCIVGNGKKRGVINEDGDIVVPICYDSIEYLYDGKGLILSINNKKGYYRTDGFEITPIIYDDIEEVNKSHISVTLANKNGIINEVGEIIIPIKYECIKHSCWDYHGFILSQNGKWGYYSSNGSEIIPIENDNIQAICRGHLLITNNNKKGIYNENGLCILEENYDDCKAVEVKKEGELCYYFIAMLNGEFGLYDNYGNQLLLIKYNSIKRLNADYLFVNDNGYWHLYNINENEICYAFEDYKKGFGNQLIVKFDGLYDIYDYVNDKFLFDSAYDDITTTSQGSFYIISNNGKRGICNDEGVFLYEIQYDYIDMRKEVVVAVLQGRLLIYDYYGTIIFDKGYQIIPGISNIKVDVKDSFWLIEAIVVKRDGKWGCLNDKFWHVENEEDIEEIKEYIPCKYDKIAYSNREIVSELNINMDYAITYFVNEGDNGELFFFKFHLQNGEAEMHLVWFEPDGKNRKKLYLFFDTETTGIPNDYKAPSTDTNNWPRLVQLAWVLTDGEGKRIHKGNMIVEPDGFEIPADSTKIHGITPKRAHYEGEPLSEVIEQFKEDFGVATYIVSHNTDFDKKIMGAEMIRLGMKDIMDTKKSYCTMQSSIDFCKIPGGYGYKYPKLQELYKRLFGKEFDNAHNAMSDVEATEKCFWEMRKRKMI